MKKHLYIFTDGYPYGKGEKPFIDPEISFLSQYYDISIVSAADEKLTKERRYTSVVPDSVRVIWCGKRRLRFRIAGYLSMFFTEEGREELGRIWREKASARTRLLRSLASFFYYGISFDLVHQFKRAGIFDDPEDSILYSFWFGRCALALALEKKDYENAHFISRIHGYELYNHRALFGRQPFQWFKEQECDAIVFASERARQCYEEENHCPEDNRHLLNRLGATFTKPENSSAGDGPFTVVSCSNVIPLKRLDLIALALKETERDIRWFHFGDGPEMDKIKKLAMAPNVDFNPVGHVGNATIKDFYAKNHVDLFITTSRTEGGCPVAVSEALSFGIPIIGTCVGGIPEQIDGNGVLLPANPDVEMVKEAILRFMDMPEDQHESMRKRSLELFYERFDLDANQPKLLEILEGRCDLG